MKNRLQDVLILMGSSAGNIAIIYRKK